MSRLYVLLWNNTSQRLMYVLLVLVYNTVRFNTIMHGNDNFKTAISPKLTIYARNMGRKLWVHWEGKRCVTSIPHYSLACIHEYTEFMLWGNSFTHHFPFGTSTMMGSIWRKYLKSSLWIKSGTKLYHGTFDMLILHYQLYRKQNVVKRDCVCWP